jgi:hypothetical protein
LLQRFADRVDPRASLRSRHEIARMGAASSSLPATTLLRRARPRKGARPDRERAGPEKPPIILVTVFRCSALARSPAFAELRWTFCVASAQRRSDVWISDVFAAPVGRQRLERELKSELDRRGHERADVQCPRPSADKVAVVNAQTTAEAFNRKLGSILHDLPACDFPLRQ